MNKVIEKWDAEITRLEDEKTRQKKELDELQTLRNSTDDAILKTHYDRCINHRLPAFERVSNMIATIQEVLDDFKGLCNQPE